MQMFKNIQTLIQGIQCNENLKLINRFSWHVISKKSSSSG